MTNYAVIDAREARLSEDFGEEFARRRFGDAAVDALPKFVRGKNKGRTKGWVSWKKVVCGGWVRNLSYGDGGYVENRAGQIIEVTLSEYDPDRWQEPGELIARHEHIMRHGSRAAYWQKWGRENGLAETGERHDTIETIRAVATKESEGVDLGEDEQKVASTVKANDVDAWVAFRMESAGAAGPAEKQKIKEYEREFLRGEGK